jgi:hypothetical protein
MSAAIVMAVFVATAGAVIVMRGQPRVQVSQGEHRTITDSVWQLRGHYNSQTGLSKDFALRCTSV